MKQIRIVIIDNDMDWIKSLTLNFINNEKDIIIVGSASIGEKAVELVKALEPDIVLLDTNDGGIDTAYAINKARIIMMSDVFSEDLIRDSFDAGAVNFMIKSDMQHLPEVIRTIHNGFSVTEVLAREYEKLKTFEYKEKVLRVLSDAEKEVINLYMLGYKRKDIASQLGKTEDTIKNQVSSSYKKLNIGRRKELFEKLKLRG